MRPVLATVVVLLFFCTSAVANPVLCIDGTCTDFECGQPIAPASVNRAASLKQAAAHWTLARVEASATAVSCDAPRTIRLLVDTKALGHDEKVTVRLGDATTSWAVDVGRERDVLLSLPNGAFDVYAEAPGVGRSASLKVPTDGAASLTLPLRPFPVIAGGVLDDRSGRAVAGAVVQTDTGVSTTTNARGRFEIAIDPREWPQALHVFATGYANASAVVPSAHVATRLDDFRLQSAGSVEIEIVERSNAAVIAVSLYRLNGDARKVGALFAEKNVVHVTGQTARVVFEGVETGEYIAVLRGKRPSERFAERIYIRDREKTARTIDLDPFTVDFKLKSQDSNPAAMIRLRNRDALWESEEVLDQKGEASVTLWQGGRLKATVESEGRLPFVATREVDALTREWVLEVPEAEVTGIVVDREENEPVAQAQLVIEMRSPDGYSLSIKAAADGSGHFRFSPVTPGTHTIRAAGKGYATQSITYQFGETETQRAVRVELSATPTVRVRVLSNGAPVSGASILAFEGIQQRGRATTAHDGTAPILVPVGESHDIFVLPMEGSMGTATISDTSEEVTVAVPTPACRVVLAAENIDHEPISNVQVVVRMNGRVWPLELMQKLESQGLLVRSRRDGRVVFDRMPCGVYEFWPVGSDAEVKALAGGAGPTAPVRVMAQPGENRVVMTFDHP